MAYSVDDIRNVVLIGHGDAGKTTLAEAMLHASGAAGRLGSVEEGTSVSDYSPEERERQISINASTLHLEWNDKLIQLMDTPGYPDFFGEVISSLSAVETAGLVVSATGGVELNTIRTWRAACEAGLAGFVVINKMDGENIDVDALLAAVGETVGASCVPFNLPLGQGEKFEGVCDVFEDADAPDGVIGDPAAAHEEAMESVIESDDELLEKYLEEGSVETAELHKALSGAVSSGELVPVFFAAGRSEKGVKELLDYISKLCPSPAALPRKATTADASEVEVGPDPDGAVAGYVFKSMTDPYVGKLSSIRLYRGTVTPDSTLVNVRTGSSYKVAHLYRVQGKEQEELRDAGPGQLVAVAKMDDVEVNDTLTAEGQELTFHPVDFPTPMVSLAVEPKKRGDEQRITSALSKLAEEDRTFQVRRDTETGELVVSGMSTLHLDVMLSRLKSRFEVEVTTSEPKIPYLETVTRTADTSYRHKKQTGGRGQYGEVSIKVEPLERGEGFEFVDEIVGGRIPNTYIPAVEKGIREKMERGILAGYRVVDVRVRLYDGSYHSVDSSEQAFKTAGSKAFQDAFAKAGPVLLEPIAKLEVTIPSEFMGDVSGDINSRRGRITGMDQAPGGLQIVQATAPLSEVSRYATELRSMTGGRGAFTMEFSHYDVVPQRIAEQVIAQAKREDEEE